MNRNKLYDTLTLLLILMLGLDVGNRKARAENIYSGSSTGISSSIATGYTLPWSNGIPAKVGCVQSNCTGPYHGYPAIDFFLQDKTIRASKKGRVVFRKDDSNHSGCSDTSCFREANLIILQHDDGYFSWYLHLSYDSIPNDIKTGSEISEGQEIGQEGLTGYSSKLPHLHFEVTTYLPPEIGSGSSRFPRELPAGIPVNFEEYSWDQLNRMSWGTSVQNNGISCPTSGGVILYKDPRKDGDPNAACGNKGEGEGWVRRDSPGWQSVPSAFNDQASSVFIPSGWSVKLYQHADSNPSSRGAWACRTAADDTINKVFWGQKMNNGFTNLDDQVSSFEVFQDTKCGVNNPPRTPSPENQNGSGENYTATNGIAPELCWSTPGDPDGDPVQYYAEVYQSAATANSGWIGEHCWRPAALDGKFFNYQWHVKARDGRGLESGWSTTWHFTIVRPNDPPHLSFDHANGVNITGNNQQIWSNTRDWNFSGTASDSDGSVDRIDVLCEGDTCNGQGQRALGTTNWSYQWNGLEGLNEIYAYAYDNKSARSSQSDRYRIKLGIDLASPSTSLNLNDQPNPAAWPTYFNLPVQVRLSATDSGTRNAISGIGELRYQIDGQGWQSVAAGSAAFEVPSDGPHSVKYYAVDHADNREAEHNASFQIDRTPPTPPAGAAEVHGVVNGQWQKTQPLPTFTWAASSDALSGVAAYQLSLEEDQGSHEVITVEIPAGGTRAWTPSKPEGMRTGSYQLRGRTRDNAGNWSDWANLFVFRFDKTPPENPTNVTHTAVITSEVWQRTTNRADFTWPIPHDEGSGINGYFVAWGTDPNATTATRIASNQFQSATPLCAATAACIGYLRLRSVDNVDNQAEQWSTAFVLRYDNAPPTADFSFAEGSTTTQTRITLRIAASDQGSGVKAMRFSYDGQTWSEWEAYAGERAWAIPAISRQSWPVYLQVRDGVGLDSPVISHSILLDVNLQQPRSTSYRLFDRAMSAGAAAQDSANYHGHGTLGQVIDSARVSSERYALVGGYEASSRALPLTIPTPAAYRLIGGIFSSSSSNTRSSRYQLVSSFGETALPNNDNTNKNPTELESPQYRLRPGFLAAVFSGPTLPTIIPGDQVSVEPPLACVIPHISINNAALFTNSVTVTLQICAPKATEMMIGNDNGLVGAQWEPYATTKTWTLIAGGQHVLPRYVYATFKDPDGTIHGAYFDDIIFDPTAPSGKVAVGGTARISQSALRANHIAIAGVSRQNSLAMLSNQISGTVDLQLNGTDDNSGISQVQISEQSDFAGATWVAYTGQQPWQPATGDGAKTVYVRFRDSAGNISAPTDAPFILDTQPPLGGIAIDRRVIGPDTITTTVYLGAQDALTGVADMRISSDPNFADAVWQPYVTELTNTVWPITAPVGNQFALYVQYRDLAGNASLVYSDTSVIDTTPPVVYAEATIGKTLTRTLTVLAYDDLSDIARMRLSNDPAMIDSVVTSAYAASLPWVFDDRRVVWVQVQDSVGNWSTPYPVYAGTGSRIYLSLMRR